jgi:hypothetical protein
MKFMKNLLVLLCLFCLASCLDIKDETEIREDGSGTFISTLDMSQLVDMMSAMGGEEFEKRKNEKIDSVIYYKDNIDAAKNLTPEEKSLLKGATARVKMNFEKKQFFLKFNAPFKNMAELQKLNLMVAQDGIGFTRLWQGAMGESGAGESGPDMNELLAVFDSQMKNGYIRKSVNAQRLKALQDNPKMTEMKQGAEMGIEVLYTVSYKLPHALVKVNNPNAKVSDDKRTVTVQNNLMELFTKPEKFEFTIEY